MTPLGRICAWIGQKTNTIVMVPHPIVVGNCSEQIYFGLLKARREGKKLALLHQYPLPWPLNYRLTNHDLIDVDSEYRAFSRNSLWHVIGSALITLYAGIFRVLLRPLRRLGYPLSDANFYPYADGATLWQPEEVMPGFSWDVVANYDWPTQLRTPLHVYLAPHKKAVAQRERWRMGLPDEAWFVCLHVRESGYHKDDRAERNATIAHYVEAIKEITSRGGWVVRMGDSTMTRLPSMERVIDYPFTPSKSYAMDLYLISECRVFIGMQSGIYDVAMLFQRPAIHTNMASWIFPFPQRAGDVGVLKHVYSKSRRRFLSLPEWMAEPIKAVFFMAPGDDYEFHENDPEELRAAVQEFLDRDGNGEPTPLQRECNELRLARGRELLNNPIIDNNPAYDLFQRYRWASRMETAIGVISDAFLRKNWARDARNPA